MDFKKLFQPLTINGMKLKNRMMVSGMVNEQYLQYHVTKSQGGWGLIITENYPVAPETDAYPHIAALWSDAHIPGQKELTRRVHEAGGKICCQLYHAGATVPYAAFHKLSVGPSPIRTAIGQSSPREMTIDEIHTLVHQFGCSRFVLQCSRYYICGVCNSNLWATGCLDQ